MVSNDKSTDDSQNCHIINYEALETDVDEAIKKASPDLFNTDFRRQFNHHN
jgi:hypothetical protein